MTQIDYRKHDEEAFLEYVLAMPPSVGQRFLKHLIQDSGHEAFEDFWRKLRYERFAREPDLEMTDNEKKALAKAVQGCSRRQFLRVGSGVAMGFGGSLLARSAMRDLTTQSRRRFEYVSQEEALGVILKLGTGVPAFMAGLTLALGECGEPPPERIARIAEGKDGEKRVQSLVKALDRMFEPVRLAMHETGVERGF